jgi:Flp pilus assembly protein TadG
MTRWGTPLRRYTDRRLTRRRRAGSAMVWSVVALLALTAFCSLAVDYGRVQVAKSELQHAADAAARYAGTGLSAGPQEARRRAVAAAADNRVDGTPVVLDGANDVEFGTWNEQARTFTPLSGAAEGGANSMRVTARRTAARGNAVPLMLAQVVGRSSCDVRAAAIVLFRPAGPVGFIGLSEFDLGNNVEVAGYNSGNGLPTGGNLDNKAVIASNGTIKLGNNTQVQGSAKVGPNGNIESGSVSGAVQNLPKDLTYPAPDMSAAAASNNNAAIGFASTGGSPLSGTAFKLGNGQTITLPGGTYYFTDFELDNNAVLTFTGPAIVYVNGPASLKNNSQALAYLNKPANLRIRQAGGFTFDISNSALLTGEIYAPGSVLNIDNNAQINGAAVAQQIKAGNNVKLYNDEILNAAGAATLSLVR